MKWSCHTIIVDNDPEPYEYLLYNTRTQALVKVNRYLKEAVDQYDYLSLEQYEEHAVNIHKLHEMGLLIKDDLEEELLLKNFLHQQKYSQGKIFFAQILTTYACNFQCVYCFQETSREMEKLSFENQELSVGWLKRRVKRMDYKGLYLNFYGGEPLLNPQAIEYIVGELRPWCESQGLVFKFDLQTNGYLMKKDLIERYKSIGLNKVRISVDGVQSVHDANRPTRGGKGTFETVMSNIIACCDIVPISIAISYEKGDVEHIRELFSYFQNKEILHKLDEFMCSPVHAALGPEGQAEKIRGQQCQCNFQDKKLAQTVIRLKEIYAEFDLSISSGMEISVCPLTRENSGVTIDQQGRLFRCNSMLGHKEFSLGDVRDDQFNQTQHKFRDLNVWQQCPQDCTYLPMCTGGCRLMSFLDNQTFQTPSCKKGYLNRMAPTFIKQEYKKLCKKNEKYFSAK